MPIPNLLQKYGIEPEAKTTGVPDLIGTKYKNFSEPEPAPLLPKPGILSRIGGAVKSGLGKASDFLAGAAEAPVYSTGSKGEIARNLPGEIVRTILPGAAALQDNPELAAEITNKDVLKEVPGAVLDVGKEFVKAPIRGATELPNLLTLGKIQPEVNFKIPGLGDIKNSDYRIAERIANGEDLGAMDITLEKGTGLLDALFFVGLARGAFVKRPTTVATGVRTPENLIGKTGGPRSFDLYTGPKPTQMPVPKSVVQSWVDQGLATKRPIDPNLPTYFEVSRVGGKDVGKIIQLRPSLFDRVTGARLPQPVPEPVEVYSREVSAGAIESAKPVVKPAPISPVVTPPKPMQHVLQPKPVAVPVQELQLPDGYLDTKEVIKRLKAQGVDGALIQNAIDMGTFDTSGKKVETDSVLYFLKEWDKENKPAPISPVVTPPKPILEPLRPEDIAKDQETIKYENDKKKIQEQLDNMGIKYFTTDSLEVLQKKLTEQPPKPVQHVLQPKPSVTEPLGTYTLEPSKAKTPEEIKKESEQVFGKESTKTGLKPFAENPTYLRQPVSKTEIKTLMDNNPEFKLNPVLTVDEFRNLTFKGQKSSFTIKSDALGLNKEKLVPGTRIVVRPQSLKEKGAPQQMRVSKDGGVEASLKDDLSNPELPATTPAEFAKRIEQLNKFGQAYAILRRTGGVPKKASGIFRHGKGAPKKGIVQLKDMTVKEQRQYMSTLSHELGHALDFNINGKQMDKTFEIFGKDLKPDQIKTIRDELKAVTDNLVGKALAQKGAGYYYTPVELFARFLQSMFMKPGDLGNLAPTALDLFEKMAVANPIIEEYLKAVEGTIDLGERKNIFLRDMRQTYTKLLGERAGTAAWNNEVRYRAMKERSKVLIEKLVKGKFKDVDDDPELLFRAAESIKITKNGVPEFGTRDFQYATNKKEADDLQNNGYKVMKNAAGTPLIEHINGKPYIRFAKQRYTPEQGKALYDQLSPAGKKLINDFTAAKEDAKDYFNREIIKDVNQINSNIEGWVHHYWEDKPIGPGGKRLQTKIASAKKQRQGAEGYVEDLQKAMQKALTEIETEKAYNAFIEDFFAQVTEPIAKGEDPKAGYVEVTGNISKGGVGTKQEMRTLIINKQGQAIPAQRPRYQMPKAIYERFQRIKEVADEASTAMRIVNNLNRYWRVNILFHMGSAATNFISGGIQYSAKILTDFYTEALTGNVAFEKTRRDLYSMLTVLTPRGWQDAPDWVYGGDMSNFYGEFMGEKAPGLKALDKSVDAYADKALKIYGTVERYWKKVIATTENVRDLKNLNVITKEGLKLPSEQEQEILDFINSEVDLFAYDYDNVPNWLQNYQQNPGWQAIKPFAKYPYKYTKQVTEMIGAAFDGTKPWQERLAKILAIGTLISLYAFIRKERQKKSKTPLVPEEAPASVSTRGRLFVGTDEKGNELFTRTAKYPFINLTEAGSQFMEGNYKEGTNELNDMLGSLAPAGTIAAALMGYRNEYQQYTPLQVIAGQSAASFVPGTRILSDIARFFDPYQRKQTTFLQGFTSFYPTTDADLQKKLRGEIRTIQVPLEGGVMPAVGEGTRRTTTDMYVRNYKNDILLGLLAGIYINRIDPDVAGAFKTRSEENAAKEAKKKTGLNPFYK